MSTPPPKKVKLESSEQQTNHSVENAPASASVTPYSLLASDDCKVQTLTVSDQHATLLISTHSKTNDQNKESTDSVQQDQDSANATATVVQSLLKLTVVPFHKLLLGSNPVLSTAGASDTHNDVKPEVNLLNNNPEASQNIISFLKEYDFKLKSESGAEYSYYHATPSSVSIPKVGSTTSAKESDEIKDEKTSSLAHTAHSFFGAFDVELISPADKRQISRALPSLGSALVEETPELYNTIVKPYIKSITDGDSLGWIQNVIEVKKEKERLLVNTDEFIVNIDTKWRSHPPPLTTPREEWYGHPSCAQDLYCLGIVKSKDIATLRDLRGEHVDLLRNMQREGLKAIETIYGVKSDQIRCFVHYQPQFYHFHVHFTRLENEIGSTVERGHLVSDILQNLEMDPLYYEKRTIVYKLRKDAPLYNLIANFTPNA